MKRRWKTGLKVSAVLSLLSVVSWVATSAHGARRLEDAIDRARVAGLPLSRPADESVHVPDHENAAPLYLAAVERSRRVEEFGEVSHLLTEYDGDGPVPEELKRALPAFEETFGLLRRAAELPGCNFPAPPDRLYEPVISLIGVLRLANALAVNAITRAESGDLDGAAQDLKAVVAMSEALTSHPAIAHQMVRIVGLQRACDAARMVLSTSASATEALDTIGFPSLHGSISDGIAGEMAFLGQLFGEDGSRTISVGDLVFGGAETAAPVWLEEFTFFLARPYWRIGLAEVIDYNRECAIAGRLPYPEGLQRMNQLVAELEEGWNPLMRMLCVKHAQFLEREAQAAARIELLRLGALVIEFQRRTGSYPASLTDLDGPLPRDPRTGSPFLLERDAGSVLLRSGEDDEVRWRLPS